MWIHIPNSICSVDMVDSASGSDSPGSPSGPSATSSGTSTASKSSRPGSKTDTSMTLPSGMTSKVSTDDPGVDEWISSVPVSRANPTQRRGYERLPEGFPMIEISGLIPSESLGKWDQESSSWRTSQASLWDLMDGNHMGAPWSESWPTQGMTRSGELFPLPTQAHRTSASGGGLWPTPNTRDTRRGCNQRQLATEVDKWHIPTPTSADVYTGNLESSQQSDDSMHSVSLPDFVHRWPTPNASSGGTHSGISAETAWSKLAKGHQIGLGAAAAMWPTPTSTERSGTNPHTGKGEGLSKTAKMFPTPVADGDRQTNCQQGGTALGVAARMLPTPTSRDHKDGDAHSCQNVPVNGLLGREVHMLPTPKARDWKGGMGTDPERQTHDLDKIVHMLPAPSSAYPDDEALLALAARLEGSLSPDWVSWLMGLPIGWTSLEPLPREDYDEWFQAQRDGTWWQEERGLPRVATGIKDRVNRLKCLGNGIVPASLALFLTR
jgi:hypothetical protein